ncbi:unnamed protein product, partial [Rotaria socialis]
MSRYIKVMENERPETTSNLPIDEQYSMSINTLTMVFPNALGLKFWCSVTRMWFFVAYENRRLVIDQDAFDHHVTFIVHRLINSSSTSLPASSTIDHQADTPPPRARRSFWQYFRCTV